jgi:hypothetical protein
LPANDGDAVCHVSEKKTEKVKPVKIGVTRGKKSEE